MHRPGDAAACVCVCVSCSPAAGGWPVPSAVLLHGFPECVEQWEHHLAALAGAGYRAVAFDQRGYSPGVRPAEVGAYGPEQLIGDVLGVADSLGWPRFDLVVMTGGRPWRG
jgi:pimeloyl-ACP methyl ester carboxylesterase